MVGYIKKSVDFLRPVTGGGGNGVAASGLDLYTGLDGLVWCWMGGLQNAGQGIWTEKLDERIVFFLPNFAPLGGSTESSTEFGRTLVRRGFWVTGRDGNWLTNKVLYDLWVGETQMWAAVGSGYAGGVRSGGYSGPGGVQTRSCVNGVGISPQTGEYPKWVSPCVGWDLYGRVKQNHKGSLRGLTNLG